MTAGTPPAEVDLSVDLVRALLAEQHPELADRAVHRAAEGWDNVTFRLGDDLAVRLPRRAAGAALIAGEQRWLPVLAPRLPLPIPVPVRTGRPGCGYPWAWSIVRWLSGEAADLEPPDPAEAAVLGAFLRALHIPSPDDAPRNPHRGTPLGERAERFALDVAGLPTDAEVDPDAVRDVFAAGTSAPPAPTAVWLHGDLHPRNVLVDGGRLRAVIDWGDLTGGDRATDVAALWHLFDEPAHAAFWEVYEPADEGLAARARAWAAALGAVLLRVGVADGDPRFTAVGRRTLRRLASS